MASLPSPSPPRRAPPSASDSGNSSPHSPTLPKKQVKVEDATNNGAFHGDDKKPDFGDGLDHLDCTQCVERFRRYDAEYSRRLMAKYFSGKTLYGGNIFDEQMTISDEVIKSSRLPCFRSYADPIVGVEDQCSNGSTPPADTHGNMPNGKHVVKKSN